MNQNLSPHQILRSENKEDILHLFSFTLQDSDELILTKFKYWCGFFFPQYFTSPDSTFHHDIDLHNLYVYRGQLDSFTNIAFRGAAKTARTKLFRGFVILNDKNHYRRYLKVLCEDLDNAKQIVTDVYNMLFSPRISSLYPRIFEKTTLKREERMDAFTTMTGVKVVASTVGSNQRGAIQEDARPDEVWFEDFESRTTLRSARKTKSIWENMEEARTGLAKGGGCIYTCNYISEQGNVHKLVTAMPSKRKKVLIVPIIKDGIPTWSRYTIAEIDQMRLDDEDFEGERLCQPSASLDVLFDRESLEKQEKRQPVKEVAGFRMYKLFDPSHRYAAGADVAGGVGLDSSTSCFIDFDTIPAQVVATSANNLIKPDTFGDELARQAGYYGECLLAPEKNNHGHATIGRLKQIYENIYTTQGKEVVVGLQSTPKEYGWHTNALTKPKMLFALAKAVEDGQIALNDEALIYECMSFTRNDLIDTENDPRLTTRHFDLLVAAAVAWQMKDHATYMKPKLVEEVQEDKPLYAAIGI